MISCAVCAHQNDDLSVICSSCGSYIQDRVPNLDFFATVWMIVESPRRAFRRIAISEQKNYALFLTLFLGIAVLFALLSLRRVGDQFDNVLYLMLLGGVGGLIVAVPLAAAFVVALYGAMQLIGGNGTLRNTYASFSWSLVPFAFSVVLVLPVGLASLGLLLFSSNPEAADIEPVVYYLLAGLDVLSLVWVLILLAIGMTVVHRARFLPALAIVLSVAAIWAGALWHAAGVIGL